MSVFGWEVYVLALLTILALAVLGLTIWFSPRMTHAGHVDTRAGDEGDD